MVFVEDAFVVDHSPEVAEHVLTCFYKDRKLYQEVNTAALLSLTG